MWRSWQLSVPATGFTHSDHFQPGSKVRRAAVASPTRTTWPRFLSGGPLLSGESKSSVGIPAMASAPLFEDLACRFSAARHARARCGSEARSEAAWRRDRRCGRRARRALAPDALRELAAELRDD